MDHQSSWNTDMHLNSIGETINHEILEQTEWEFESDYSEPGFNDENFLGNQGPNSPAWVNKYANYELLDSDDSSEGDTANSVSALWATIMKSIFMVFTLGS